MADNVTIQLNMTNGEIHIQAPAESLDTIFDKLEAFLPKLADIRTEYVPDKADSITVEEDDHSVSAAEKSEHTDVLSKNSTKRKRTSSSKKSRNHLTWLNWGWMKTADLLCANFIAKKILRVRMNSC